MNSEVPLWPHTKRVTIIGGAFARERHRDRLGRTAVVREGAGLAAASRDSSSLRYLGSVVAYLWRVSFVKRAGGLLVVSGCGLCCGVRARGRPGLSRCSTIEGSAT